MPTSAAVADLQTPALLVDAASFAANLATMSGALPGPRLRPHVKAHKCTELARAQHHAGHHNFTCATLGEMEGMTAAGLHLVDNTAERVVDTWPVDLRGW